MSGLRKEKRIYGRRKSRPLNKMRQDAFDALFPQLQLPEQDMKEDGTVDPAVLFDRPYNSLWMEIGFGNGEHLAALMERYEDHAFIGAEPYLNGMAAFLKHIHDTPHRNVRVFMDDAMMVVRSLQSSTVDGFYVLNPDPWPKTKHHKRRIINQDNLDDFARVLKDGGKLVMATDVDDLAEWMVTEASNHPSFIWTAGRAGDWKTPPEDWIPTRYEEKGIQAGRRQSYLIFEKLPSKT